MIFCCEELSTPDWFKVKDPEISIIIPMFRSSKVIVDQIENWSFDDLNAEIIYVSDSCPDRSEHCIIPNWQKTPVGRIFLLKRNFGFAIACNTGAYYARGKYLVFLNADTVVTKGWLKPLYELIQDKSIGIIGNLQLGDDGLIESAGSEWMQDSKTFDHIGKNTYKKKRLDRPMHVSQVSFTVEEREMVTGCCFMVRKEVFEEVGKFDTAYRIGYWEDSDFNMKVREAGYKIFFHPESVIYHKLSHSGGNKHPFLEYNCQRFMSKWVNNGKINRLLNLNT